MIPKVNLPKIVIVLGMHRSGTSLLAQYLYRVGLYAGDDFVPANEYNTEGYLEYQPLVDFHEKLLSYTGNTWYAPSQSINNHDLLVRYADEARLLIARMDASGKDWFWKDPRMPVFLEFWKEILKGREIHFIITLRHPSAIANSLYVRDNLPVVIGLSLWEYTMMNLFSSLRAVQSYVLVNYEQVLDNPALLAEQLLQWTEPQLSVRADPARHQRARQVVKAHLNHSGKTKKEILSIEQEKLWAAAGSAAIPLNIEADEGRLSQLRKLFLLFTEFADSALQKKFTRLFYSDSTHDFNEENRVFEVLDSMPEIISFTLPGIRKVNLLRFDPLNDYVFVKIHSVDLLREGMPVQALIHLTSNAFKEDNGTYLFDIPDPQILIHLPDNELVEINEVRVSLTFIKRGFEVLPLVSGEKADAIVGLAAKVSLKDQAILGLEQRLTAGIADNAELRTSLTQTRSALEQYEGEAKELQMALAQEKWSNQNAVSQLGEQLIQVKDAMADLHTRLTDQLLAGEVRHQSSIHSLEARAIDERVAWQKLNQGLQEQLSRASAVNSSIASSFAFKLSKIIMLIINPLNILRHLRQRRLFFRFRRIALEKGLFDEAYYLSHQADVRMAGIPAIRHYFFYGGSELRDPSANFSSAQYVERYPDVRHSGINPLWHFIRYGESEGRILFPESGSATDRQAGGNPSPDIAGDAGAILAGLSCEDEIRIIEESGLFSRAYYLSVYDDVRLDGMDPVVHYCYHGWMEGRNPSADFDTRFYQNTCLYHDPESQNPLVHYILTGRARGCFASEAAKAGFAEKESAAKGQGNSSVRMFNPFYQARRRTDFYRSVYSLTVSRYGGFRPTIGKLFRKLVQAGPVAVYNEYTQKVAYTRSWFDTGNGSRQPGHDGEDAGRSGKRLRQSIPGSQTILFIGHDALLAGAQVVLLNMVKWIRLHTALDIRVILLREGALLSEYEKYAPVIIWESIRIKYPQQQKRQEFIAGQYSDIRLIYGNTVLAAGIYDEFRFLNVPYISHIHELEKSILLYIDKNTIRSLEKITDHFVACSAPVADNLVKNHKIEPQSIATINAFIESRSIDLVTDKTQLRKKLGLIEDHFIVIGCGTIYWRKGVDLFIETAKKLKERHSEGITFYWIGDNYWNFDQPSGDIVSWTELEETINRLQLPVIFLGTKPNVGPYLQASDLFYLPSREDPFPLVCLEAAQNGIPVICFDQAGGMPEFVEADAGFVIGYLDTDAVADAILLLRDQPDRCLQYGRTARLKLDDRHLDDIAVPAILGICQSVLNVKPMVSVLVPVFNQEKFVEIRIESILNQTFRDFEIIILDDASGDATCELARRFEKYPQVRIIRNPENSGSAFRQWKKGLAAARGEFVWIAEGDDYCEPDFLHELLPFFNDPAVALAFADSIRVDGKGISLGDYQAYYEQLDFNHWKMDYAIPGVMEINYGLGAKNTIPNISAAVFRKSAVTDGMLDSLNDFRFSGDWFFYVQLIKGRKIAFRSRKLNFHRKHGETLTHRFNENRADRQVVLDEASRIHRFILNNYLLVPSFLKRWERYLEEQVGAFYPNTPVSDFNNYYPYSSQLAEIKEVIAKSSSLKRRLVFVTTNDYSHDGGSEQLWIQTALEMGRQGNRVMVIIKKWIPEPYFIERFREHGIDIQFKGVGNTKSLKSFAPDLVIVNIGDQDEGTEWYSLCQELNFHYIIINHLTKEPKYWPIRVGLQPLVKEGYLRAGQVLFTSRNNRALMEKRLSCEIPNAGQFYNPFFAKAETRLPFPSGKRTIRFAMPSRLLNMHKGQEIAIEVFRQEKWIRRHAELHFYGNGPDEVSLRETVDRHNLKNVFFHDPSWQLPKPDLESIWRDNHALLMTSFMEGMPLVLVSAMFYERVAVVTDVGGHSEIIDDNDNGFIATEPTMMAVDEAMERAWERLPEWEIIGRRARVRVAEFMPENPVGHLADLISIHCG
jgi:glycosyltransferase involved in cell wall biosynthesis